MLGELDVNCTRVSVTELRENTFYASITLAVNGRELEIDSRPSDALALAVRSGAPIFAAEDVIAESAIEFEHEVEDTEEVVDKFKEFLDQVTPEDFGPRSSDAQRPRRRPARSTRAIELVEGDAGGLGGLRQQARLGQARDRVGLEHGTARRSPSRASGRRARSRGSRAAPQTASASSCARRRAPSSSSAGQTNARAADLVARLEVVESSLLRDRLDDRQRLRAVGPSSTETARSRPATWRSSSTLRVVGERRDERGRARRPPSGRT